MRSEHKEAPAGRLSVPNRVQITNSLNPNVAKVEDARDPRRPRVRISFDHNFYKIQDKIAVPSINEMIPNSLKV
jgi:hypothetical protein